MSEDAGTVGKVLILDDEQASRELIGFYLRSKGYECLDCGDAAAALRRLESDDIDVVLLDSSMPGQTGTDFFAEIKERAREVVVVVLADFLDFESLPLWLDNGAYDCIFKSFSMDDLEYAVQRALEKRSLERKILHYEDHLEKRSEIQARQNREAFLGTMATLSFALEGKDSYTAGHSRRVSELALAVGRRMLIGDARLEDLRWGSLLHDLGKIAVDQKIMNKPDRLTPQEYECVMTHPVVGASMVASVVNNIRIVEIIEYHHHSYNGLGTTQKIKGKEIPLLARIVSVADAFDAMTSERPYRPALARIEALAEIKLESGTRFDPDIVDIFLELSSKNLPSRKETILVSDDEETIRLLIRSVLGNDYNVIEAANGQEAVDLADSKKPSLILMDIFMPTKDGLTACYEIKNNPASKNIPIVMLTGHGEEQNQTLSTRMGADGCISKPFNVINLIEVVERLLKREVPIAPVNSY